METRDILHEDFKLLVGIEDTQETSAKVSYEETQFSDTEKSLQGRQEEISLENITKRSSQASILQDEPASTTDDICLNDDVNKTTTAATKHTAAPPSNSGGELYNDTNSIRQSSGKELADSDTSVREKIIGKDGNRFQKLAEELEKKVEQNQEDIQIDHANLYMIKQALEDYGPEHESLARGNFLDMLPKGEKRNVPAEEYPSTEDTSTGSSVKTIEDGRNQKAPEHMDKEIRMETENKEEENPTRANDGGKERQSKKTESEQNVPSRDEIEHYKQTEEHDLENKENEQKNTNIESRVFEIDHLPVLEHTETKELPRTQLSITENSTVGLTLEVDREKENPEAGTSGNIIAYKDILLQDNKVPGREVCGAIISGGMVNISTNNEFQWTDKKQIEEHESLDTGCRELENYRGREYETTQSTTGSKHYNTQAEELGKSIDLNEISHGVIQTIEATAQISNKIFGDQGYEEPDRKSKSTGNQVPMDEEDSDNLLLHQTLTMHHLERSKMNPEIHTEKQESGSENTNENAEMISENSEATSKIKQDDDTEISRSNKKDEALKQQDRTDDMLSAIQKNNVKDDENENLISRRLIKKMAYAHSDNIDNRTESSTNDSEYIPEGKEERKDLFTQAEKTELMQQTKDPKAENCNKENELSDGNNDKLPHEAVSDSSNTTDLVRDDSSVMEYKNAGDNQNTVSCQQKLRMDVVETLDEILDTENFISKIETEPPAECPTNANEPSDPVVNKEGFRPKDTDLVISEHNVKKQDNEKAAHLPETEKETDKNSEISDETKPALELEEEPERLTKLDSAEKCNILKQEERCDNNIEITNEEFQQDKRESDDQTSSATDPKKMVKRSEHKIERETEKLSEDADIIHIKDKGSNIDEFTEASQINIVMEQPEVNDEDNSNKSLNVPGIEVSCKDINMFGTTKDPIALSDASDRNIPDQCSGFVGVGEVEIVKQESTNTVDSHTQQDQIPNAENFINKVETQHPAEWPTNANEPSNPFVNKRFGLKDSDLVTSEKDAENLNNEIAAHLPATEKEMDKNTETSDEAKPATNLEEPEMLGKLDIGEKRNILQSEEKHDKDIEIIKEEVQQANTESVDQTSSSINPKKMVKLSENKFKGPTDKLNEDIDPIHIKDKGYNIEEFIEETQTKIEMKRPEVKDEDNWNKSHNTGEIEVLPKVCDMFGTTHDFIGLSDASDRNITDQHTGFVGVDDIVKQESTYTVNSHIQQAQILEAENFISKIETEHPAEWPTNANKPSNPVVNKEGFRPKDSNLTSSEHNVKKQNNEIAAHLPEKEKQADKSTEISHEAKPASELEEPERLVKLYSAEKSNILQPEERCDKDIEITNEEVQQDNRESDDQTSSASDIKKMVKRSEHKVEGATEKQSEDVDIIHIEDKGSNIEEFTEASQTNIVIEQPEVNDEDNSNKSLNAPKIEILCKDINMFGKTKDLTALSDASDRNIPDQHTGFVGVGEDEIVKQESTNTVGGHTQPYQQLKIAGSLQNKGIPEYIHNEGSEINVQEPVAEDSFEQSKVEDEWGKVATTSNLKYQKEVGVDAPLREMEENDANDKPASQDDGFMSNKILDAKNFIKKIETEHPEEWLTNANEPSNPVVNKEGFTPKDSDLVTSEQDVNKQNSEIAAHLPETEKETEKIMEISDETKRFPQKIEGAHPAKECPDVDAPFDPVFEKEGYKPTEPADLVTFKEDTEKRNNETAAELAQIEKRMEANKKEPNEENKKATSGSEVASEMFGELVIKEKSHFEQPENICNEDFEITNGEDKQSNLETSIQDYPMEDSNKIEHREIRDEGKLNESLNVLETEAISKDINIVGIKHGTIILCEASKRNIKDQYSNIDGEDVLVKTETINAVGNNMQHDENQESYRGSREKNKFDSSFKVLDTEESKNETQNVNLTIVDIYKEQAAGNVTSGSPEKFYRETQSFTAEKLHDHQLVREEDQREISGFGEKVEEQVGLVNLADRKGEETESNYSVKSKDKQVKEGHYMPLEQNVERKHVIEDREGSIAKDVELRNHHVIFTETKEGFGTLEAAKEPESTSIEETYMPSDVAHGVNIPDKKDEHAESGTECAEASASPTELIKLESLISNLVINDLQDKIDNKESLSTLGNSSFVSRVSQLQEERENEKKNGEASQYSHVQHVDETYVSLLKTDEKDKETYPITTNQASKEVLHVPEDDATQSEDLQNDQRIEELPVSQFLMNQILLGESLEDDAIPHVNAEIHEDTDSRLKNMSIPEKEGATGLIFGNVLTNGTSISNNNVESLMITEKYSSFPLKQETSNVMYKVDDREADTEIHEKQHESLLFAKEVDENPNNEEISQSSYLELNDGLKSRNEMEEGIELDHLKASSPENVAPSSLTPVDEMKVEPYTAENNIRTLEKNEIDLQASLEQKMSNTQNEVKDGQVDTAIEKDVGNQHCTEEANKSGEDEKSSYTVSKESEGSGERNDPKPSAIEPSNPEANVAKEIILFKQESAEPDCSTIVNTADIQVSAMGNSLISNLDVTTKLLDEEILVSKDRENVMETTEEKPNEEILEKKLIEIERTVVIESPISTARGEQYSEEKEEAMENVSYKPGGDPPSSSVEDKQKVDVRGDNSEKENTGVKEDEQAETEKIFITDNTVSSDNAREAQIQELQPAVSEQLVLAMPAVSENILEKEVTAVKTKTLGNPRDASSDEKESVQVRDKNIIAEGKTEDDDAESILMEEIKGPNQKQQKKHHGLLSGVGSKVKHSIINKVKKAITCTTVQLPK